MKAGGAFAGALGIVALAGVCLLGAPAQRQSVPARPAAADLSLINKYCLGCHSARQGAGGVALEGVDLARAGADAPLLERVSRQLRAGLMPPAGSPRPDRPASLALAAEVERAIDSAAAPNPGRPVLHRLNRVEYANAVRDLLDVDIDVSSQLPADESHDGFDNIGSVLSISSSLLDRYLAAARRISRLAVGDRSIGPAFASQTYRAPQSTFQSARLSEDLPFGSRGGMAIHHQFPLDAEYVIRIRLQRNILGYVRGLTEPHAIELRLDGKRLQQTTIGGVKQFLPAPLSFTGVILGDPRWEAYAVTADDGLETRVRTTAGPHVVAVTFPEEAYAVEGVMQPELTGLAFAYTEFSSAPSGPWGPAVDAVTIDGPYNPTGPGATPSRTRIFTCTREDEGCARTILSALATRGYRRQVTGKDVERLMTFYRSGSANGGGLEGGVETALERLLVDPSFLFRVERDPVGAAPGAAYRITDIELASRLSFFLWSSIPDDALIELAIAGKLHEPATLDAQVARMLADPRARALVENFAEQWLSLRQLRMPTLEEEILPEYDGNLRDAFLRETRLFIADQVRADHSVLDLLTAKYTFVNDRLARHYGIPGVYGSHFRRVTVGDERAGILGHGSVLTTTSYPTRTSPVLRGRWLLDTMLGTPPPPPPPNIPVLPAGDEQGRPLSMRQRTERHRANPVCAGCHARMDPLGFALENFDAIGRWRTIGETGAPIDASGAFADGSTFTGVSGVRSLIASRPEDFVRTLTSKLLTYALGRAVESYDMPAVRAIVRDAAPGNYRWSSLILGIVRSVPFQMRRVES